MQQFAGRYWPNIVRPNGDQGNGVSAAINKFDLVAATFLVDVHDRTDIAAVQSLVCRVAIQYDKGMFSNHWF